MRQNYLETFSNSIFNIPNVIVSQKNVIYNNFTVTCGSLNIYFLIYCLLEFHRLKYLNTIQAQFIFNVSSTCDTCLALEIVQSQQVLALVNRTLEV